MFKPLMVALSYLVLVYVVWNYELYLRGLLRSADLKHHFLD